MAMLGQLLSVPSNFEISHDRLELDLRDDVTTLNIWWFQLLAWKFGRIVHSTTEMFTKAMLAIFCALLEALKFSMVDFDQV